MNSLHVAESYMPDINPDTIGYSFILERNKAIAAEINASSSIRAINEVDTPTKIQRIRGALSRLRPGNDSGLQAALPNDIQLAHQKFVASMERMSLDERNQFDTQMEHVAKEAPLLDVFHGDVYSINHANMLSRFKRADTSEDLAANVFINALERNIHTLHKIQESPEFKGNVKEERERFGRELKRAAGNWLHPSSLERYETMRETPIYATEGLGSYAVHTQGYYKTLKDFIGITPDSEGYRAIQHELGHARIEDRTDVDRSYYQDFAWFLAELLVEHTAMVFRGEAEPDKFNCGSGGYQQERIMMQTLQRLATKRGVRIPLSELTMMFSAPVAERMARLEDIDERISAVVPELTDSMTVLPTINVKMIQMVTNNSFAPEVKDYYQRKKVALGAITSILDNCLNPHESMRIATFK